MIRTIDELVDYCYEIINCNNSVIDLMSEIKIDGYKVKINPYVFTIENFDNQYIYKIPYGTHNVCEIEENILDLANDVNLEQWFSQIIGSVTTSKGNIYYLYERTDTIDFGNITLSIDTSNEIKNEILRLTNATSLFAADSRLLMILFQEFGVMELEAIDTFLEEQNIHDMSLSNWGYSRMNRRYVLTSWYHNLL